MKGESAGIARTTEQKHKMEGVDHPVQRLMSNWKKHNGGCRSSNSENRRQQRKLWKGRWQIPGKMARSQKRIYIQQTIWRNDEP